MAGACIARGEWPGGMHGGGGGGWCAWQGDVRAEGRVHGREGMRGNGI